MYRYEIRLKIHQFIRDQNNEVFLLSSERSQCWGFSISTSIVRHHCSLLSSLPWCRGSFLCFPQYFPLFEKVCFVLSFVLCYVKVVSLMFSTIKWYSIYKLIAHEPISFFSFSDRISGALHWSSNSSGFEFMLGLIVWYCSKRNKKEVYVIKKIGS